MAGHGGARHLKRITVKPLVRVPKKTATWLKRPAPGKHDADNSISILALLRDVLKVAYNAREARSALQAGQVLIDGTTVQDPGTSVGLMDVVSLPALKQHYRIVNTHNGLQPIPVTTEEAGRKLCKIKNKHSAGTRVQLNLHDGRNVLIEREEDQFKTGDSVLLKVPQQKIDGFIKLEKGANCYVAQGKHAGEIGILEEIKEHRPGAPSDARLKSAAREVITRKGYLFAVDKNFKTK